MNTRCHASVFRMGRHWLAVLATSAIAAPLAGVAAEVEFVGSMGSRAVLQIDGGAPRTVAVGASTPEGVKLLALDGDQAVVEIDGKRSRIPLGGQAIRAASANDSARLVLHADSQGHFESGGSINGAPMRFLVDTGASLVSLGRSDALRARIDYWRGEPATSLTAAGPTRVWRVKLDSLQIGPMTLRNVDAAVHEQDLPVVLLGMSVLNRVDMRREGRVLTLQQRF